MPWTCCAASRLSVPAPNESAIASSNDRRETSDISLPHFFGQILGRSPGQRDDGERRIFVRIAQERSGVCDEKILHFVRLAVFVQNRFRGIVAHAYGPELVNDVAAFRNT